jgi:hypothetical protein
VNHTRGGHCVSRGIVWALAKAVKACKTERYPGGLGEIQQRLALIVQPLLVGAEVSQLSLVRVRSVMGHLYGSCDYLAFAA